MNGVSGRVVGIRLGLVSSKSNDNHGNAKGEFVEYQTAGEFTDSK
jgi:hypothetical protein